MEEVEIVTLSDKRYYLMDRVELNSSTYLVLVNINDEKDVCVRKEVEKEGKKYLVGLSSDEELQSVLKEFAYN